MGDDADFEEEARPIGEPVQSPAYPMPHDSMNEAGDAGATR